MSQNFAAAYEQFSRAESTRRTAAGDLVGVCPAHDDHKPSLSFRRLPGERYLVHCHAGCPQEAVLRALGIGGAVQSQPQFPQYIYVDEHGQPVFRVRRYAGKKFLQDRYVDGRWVKGIQGVRRVPYRLDLLSRLAEGERVFITEGEKDVHTIELLGGVATTNSGGAGQWKPEWNELFRGREVIVCGDNDPPGKDRMARIAQSLQPIAASVHTWLDADGPPKSDISDAVAAGRVSTLQDVLDRSVRVEATAHPALLRMSDVQSQPVEWLWDRVIPRGKVTIFTGDPDLGKSFITLDLAARMSSGRWLPMCTELRVVGQDKQIAGSTLLLCSEDDPSDTLRPRLECLQADLERIHVLQGFERSDGSRALPDLVWDLSQIERVCDSIRGLQMMVVDPISAYLPGIDTNSQTEVRRAMENLTLFAARRRIAVVLIAHNRKAAAATAKHRVLGSLAFTAAARSVFGAARDPGSDRKRLLLPIKTNLSRNPPAFRYEIDDAGVHWEYLGDDRSADDDLERGSWNNALRECVGGLQNALLVGPQRVKEIESWANDCGFAYKVLVESLERVGVTIEFVDGHAYYVRREKSPSSKPAA